MKFETNEEQRNNVTKSLGIALNAKPKRAPRKADLNISAKPEGLITQLPAHRQ